MDIEDFSKKFGEKMQELCDFVESDDLKDILGTEAINHFQSSFDNEGFTDSSVEKWKDVKRKDKDSKWYGHSGQTGKYSPARASAKILTGETKELRNAFEYDSISEGVRVKNTKPYAAVHQFGLPAKIYGKKVFQMPARPFVGNSTALVRKINAKISRKLHQIIK